MPASATPMSFASIGTVTNSARYLSRNPTPKNSAITPMRVSALPPVNHAHSGLTRGATGTLAPPPASLPGIGAHIASAGWARDDAAAPAVGASVPSPARTKPAGTPAASPSSRGTSTAAREIAGAAGMAAGPESGTGAAAAWTMAGDAGTAVAGTAMPVARSIAASRRSIALRRASSVNGAAGAASSMRPVGALHARDACADADCGLLSASCARTVASAVGATGAVATGPGALSGGRAA
jgi:hypothetical protein